MLLWLFAVSGASQCRHAAITTGRPILLINPYGIAEQWLGPGRWCPRCVGEGRSRCLAKTTIASASADALVFSPFDDVTIATTTTLASSSQDHGGKGRARGSSRCGDEGRWWLCLPPLLIPGRRQRNGCLQRSDYDLCGLETPSHSAFSTGDQWWSRTRAGGDSASIVNQNP